MTSDSYKLSIGEPPATGIRAQDPPGRVPGFEPTAAERATQLTVASLVAVTEHFVADRLRAVPGVTEDDLRSWPKQIAAWNTHAGVRLEDFTSYPAFRGFNEARNAIMHGRGRLTPRQLKPNYAPQLWRWVTAAGLRVVRYEVIIGINDVDHCAEVCTSFINAVDAAAHRTPASDRAAWLSSRQ